MSETLLETARSRDMPRLVERLEHASRNQRSGRQPLTVPEQLVDEALWYAKAGDLAEATLRLERRAEPKWPSEKECQSAYKKAMAEKRARITA